MKLTQYSIKESFIIYEIDDYYLYTRYGCDNDVYNQIGPL